MVFRRKKTAQGECDTNSVLNHLELETGAPVANKGSSVTVLRGGNNPAVFFDITIGGAPAGRITTGMQLYANVVPNTACLSLSLQHMIKEEIVLKHETLYLSVFVLNIFF